MVLLPAVSVTAGGLLGIREGLGLAVTEPLRVRMKGPSGGRPRELFSWGVLLEFAGALGDRGTEVPRPVGPTGV